METKIKKISDIKFQSKKNQNKPTEKTSFNEVRINNVDNLKNTLPVKKHLVKDIPPTSPSVKKISIKKNLFRLLFLLILVVVFYVISLLSYHAKVTVTNKQQNLSVDKQITVVASDVFLGNSHTLPYYRYIIDKSEPVSYDQLKYILPPETISHESLIFSSDTKQEVVFFKKSDIVQFLEEQYIDTSYHNRIVDIHALTITRSLSTPYTSGDNFIINLSGPFTAKSFWDTTTLAPLLTDLDKYMCKEKAAIITEINVDKCTVFPFWYSKIPKNPKFIRIITK